MKRVIFIISVCFVLVFSGGSAMALYILDGSTPVDVGFADTFIEGTDELDNSSPQEEIDWVNTALGLLTDATKYTVDDFFKNEDDFESGDWMTVYGGSPGIDIYAYSLVASPPPEYFLLKIGGGNFDGFIHNLYANVDELEWAVIDFSVLPYGTTIDITKISHVSEFGGGAAPVPEPATMLLFGTGLIGLAGLRARKRNQ